MTRDPHWPARLEEYLRSSQQTKFRHGSFDCALFVASAILAMTGTDIAESFRNAYRTRQQAIQRSKELGLGASIQSLTEGVAALYSLPEVPPLCASRGDMVLIPRAKGRDHSLGIVALNGREIYWALRVGWGTLPLSRACRAWRI